MWANLRGEFALNFAYDKVKEDRKNYTKNLSTLSFTSRYKGRPNYSFFKHTVKLEM